MELEDKKGGKEMSYIIQQVAMGAICIVSIAAVAFSAVEVVRLFIDDLRR